jgi:hypothetical protein
MEALTSCTRDELIGAPFKGHFTDPPSAEAAIKPGNRTIVAAYMEDALGRVHRVDGRRASW